MQNVKSYFSSWTPFWKSSKNSSQSQTLTLSPSNINFTNSSLGDLKHSVIDEKLMIDISTKLVESISPPKLQICSHNNQWFALNNSHLLVYRQLERIGLCDAVVCDIVRSQDIPNGIRQTLLPTETPQEQQNCFQNLKGRTGEQYMSMGGDGSQTQDEVIYCADIQADTCGYLEGEDQCDSSIITCGDSDQDADSEDEQCEWQINPSLATTKNCNNRFDEIDLEDDDGIEDSQKEMQSLL